jgi:hypothetical protein
VAEALHKWISCVFQAATPFVSSEDIRKGRRWPIELAQQLEGSNFGIVCLTHANQSSEWLLFEAGALSKAAQDSRVCTLLLGGLKWAEISGPLSHFQHTVFEKADFRKLASSLNDALGRKRLNDDVMGTLFEKCWPELEKAVQNALADKTETLAPEKTERKMIEELLELCTFVARNTVNLDAEARARSEFHRLREYLRRDVRQLDLSERLRGILERAGVTNVGLIAMQRESELLMCPGMKKEDIATISDRLEPLGLCIGMRFDETLLDDGSMYSR